MVGLVVGHSTSWSAIRPRGRYDGRSAWWVVDLVVGRPGDGPLDQVADHQADHLPGRTLGQPTIRPSGRPPRRVADHQTDHHADHSFLLVDGVRLSNWLIQDGDPSLYGVVHERLLAMYICVGHGIEAEKQLREMKLWR
ncbi:hypothetical protein VIGAN_06163800 [Vigna angularis var. angularis]|uniref:Uncharacterized protein n=1 Tax=Vigna angularis var. angularis TaxID=157739 RepID=A0A0S3SC42_PHAAN|nr:hypothetical protein VIGAN_06163800 [Vigna angularis var. angularis]